MEINDTMLNNTKVQVSIIAVEGKQYLVYLHTVGMFRAMVEDIETKERAYSDEAYSSSGEAVMNAIEKLNR